MKHCPDCGKELGVGVVKCWNPDCAAEFVVPVDAESSDPPIKKPDDLRRLESEYQLATRGVATRAPKTYATMMIGFSIFLVAAFLLAANGKQLFRGWPLVGCSALLRLPYSSIITPFTDERANSRQR
jgi:hypothetical protein